MVLIVIYENEELKQGKNIVGAFIPLWNDQLWKNEPYDSNDVLPMCYYCEAACKPICNIWFPLLNSQCLGNS